MALRTVTMAADVVKPSALAISLNCLPSQNGHEGSSPAGASGWQGPPGAVPSLGRGRPPVPVPFPSPSEYPPGKRPAPGNGFPCRGMRPESNSDSAAWRHWRPLRGFPLQWRLPPRPALPQRCLSYKSGSSIFQVDGFHRPPVHFRCMKYRRSRRSAAWMDFPAWDGVIPSIAAISFTFIPSIYRAWTRRACVGGKEERAS